METELVVKEDPLGQRIAKVVELHHEKHGVYPDTLWLPEPYYSDWLRRYGYTVVVSLLPSMMTLCANPMPNPADPILSVYLDVRPTINPVFSVGNSWNKDKPMLMESERRNLELMLIELCRDVKAERYGAFNIDYQAFRDDLLAKLEEVTPQNIEWTIIVHRH